METSIAMEDRPGSLQTVVDGLFMRLGQSSAGGLEGFFRKTGIHYYRRRLRRDPYDSNLHYFIGNLYMGAGQYDAAVDAYAHVVHLAPDHATTYGNLACACIKAHRYEEARTAMEHASRLKPEHVPYLYMFGYICGSLKDYPEAVGACQRALLLEPDHEGALFLAGYGSLKLGQYEEAARYLRRYSNLHPDHTPTHRYLGLAYIKLGRMAEAMEALTKAWGTAAAPDELDDSLPEPQLDDAQPAKQNRAFFSSGKMGLWKRQGRML